MNTSFFHVLKVICLLPRCRRKDLLRRPDFSFLIDVLRCLDGNFTEFFYVNTHADPAESGQRGGILAKEFNRGISHELRVSADPFSTLFAGSIKAIIDNFFAFLSQLYRGMFRKRPYRPAVCGKTSDMIVVGVGNHQPSTIHHVGKVSRFGIRLEHRCRQDRNHMARVGGEMTVVQSKGKLVTSSAMFIARILISS